MGTLCDTEDYISSIDDVDVTVLELERSDIKRFSDELSTAIDSTIVNGMLYILLKLTYHIGIL